MAKLVELSVERAVAHITLERPEKLNALNRPLLAALLEACRSIERERRVKVAILRGAGQAFSSGGDVSEFANIGHEQAMEGRRERSELARQVGQTIEAMRATVIAQLHGRVVGGALVLALACDFRVVAKGTTFSLPEAEMGIPLGWGGIPRLVRELGPSRTKELVLLQGELDAAEAVGLGLANRLVELEELDTEVESLATRLRARTALSLTVTKRHVNAFADAIASAARSYADDEVLALTLVDPETAAARRAYAARTAKLERETDSG
jgi:enoyl-CoA hydratase/carnithine racemase